MKRCSGTTAAIRECVKRERLQSTETERRGRDAYLFISIVSFSPNLQENKRLIARMLDTNKTKKLTDKMRLSHRETRSLIG